MTNKKQATHKHPTIRQPEWVLPLICCLSVLVMIFGIGFYLKSDKVSSLSQQLASAKNKISDLTSSESAASTQNTAPIQTTPAETQTTTPTSETWSCLTSFDNALSVSSFNASCPSESLGSSNLSCNGTLSSYSGNDFTSVSMYCHTGL